ncbi:MAG TPA: hypothetical protein VFZ26_05185 [Gemmatimonadales bacterium]
MVTDGPFVETKELIAGHRLAGLVHVAVVTAEDSVRLVAVGPSRAAVLARLARYVREWAPHRLWPRDAERVTGALRAGEVEAAVVTYFEAVGERWDRERLHIEVAGPVLSPEWAPS